MNQQLTDLGIKFERVKAPPGLGQEQGKVKVVVTNQGSERYKGPLDINLYASADSLLDLPLNQGNFGGTDELLGSLERNVNLAPGQSKTLTLNFASSEFRAPSVVAPGAYYLIAEVDPNKAIVEIQESNNSASVFVSTDGTDVILDWNSVFINAIQANVIGLVAGDPTAVFSIEQRDAAIMHTAMHDAINAIERVYQPYFVQVDASEAAGASPEAAAVGAAYQALINLYPGQKDVFEAQLIRSLAEIPDGVAKDAGFALGINVANQILALRQDDGVLEAFLTPYTAEPTPGIWRRTPSNTNGELGPEALLPGWSNLSPFAIPSPKAILLENGVDGPPSLTSEQYAREVNEVRVLGGLNDTAATDVIHTAEQTEIARFWAHDRYDSYQPIGQYNIIAQEVALQEGNSLADNARLFALLNIALSDAGVVAFDAKYTYNQWRPVTAIREGDTDGNPATGTDQNWNPFLDNPPFPDYIAAHATSGAAAGQVLASFYGTDNINYVVHSQELPGVARSFDSFTGFVEENAISRLYGGVHLRSSNEEGIISGRAVGNYVFNNFLRPLDAIGVSSEVLVSPDLTLG